MQRRALPRERTSPTLAKQGVSYGVQGVETEGRGRVSYTVRFLAVLWAGGERVGNNGMAVVSGKWVPEGEVGGWAHIFSPVLPVGRPLKPSISPTSSTRSQVKKSAVLQDQLLFTSISLTMATVDLSHVQLIWQPPLKPTSSKRVLLYICKNGRSGPITSLRDQPALLYNKADEILGRDKQPESAVAPAQYQGRDSAFQQEGNAVGAQGAVREDSRNEPG
jgi:hypothetical protein